MTIIKTYIDNPLYIDSAGTQLYKNITYNFFVVLGRLFRASVVCTFALEEIRTRF